MLMTCGHLSDLQLPLLAQLVMDSSQLLLTSASLAEMLIPPRVS